MRAFWKMLRMMRLLLAQDSLLAPELFGRGGVARRLAQKTFTLGAPRLDPAKPEVFARRIAAFGPSYIKLGQFLATRPDMIGAPLAHALAHLQDRVPPFPNARAAALLAEHSPQADEIKLGRVVAAASIAQVHTARYRGRKVAVKILRPKILEQLQRELALFARLGAWFTRLDAEARRLRPRAAVAVLQDSVAAECDLRLEAAALAEMAENTANDKDFAVPAVLWDASSEQILVTDWVDGVRIDDLAALAKAKHARPALAKRLIDLFLTHALRDGFFHADMHPGNIFVQKNGTIVALDLGITGRLDEKTRHYLAQILHGFLTRDYVAAANVHARAGYVPQESDENMARFAQALRAIGEPLHDRPHAHEISMARLLEQLFATTRKFAMRTQPQLLLLQKTMLVVEGIARQLDPKLDIWQAARPAVEAWMLQQRRAQLQWLVKNGPALLDKAQASLQTWLQESDNERKTIAQRAAAPPPAPAPTPDKTARRLSVLAIALALGALGFAIYIYM